MYAEKQHFLNSKNFLYEYKKGNFESNEIFGVYGNEIEGYL
jgi:hypothetical protein